MRPLTIIAITILLFSNVMFAQVGINDDNSQPDPSAGSTEFSYVRGMAHNFFDGYQNANQKTNTYYVRAVRAF